MEEQVFKDKPKKNFKVLRIIIILLIILFSYMAYFNSFIIKIKEYSLTDSNLPKSFDGLKIAQISDIHYGTSIKEINLKMIVKRLNELKPDFVVFTGDLIDTSTNHTEKVKSELTYYLGSIEAKTKLAIKGDNDAEDFNDLMTNSGFTYLNDEVSSIYSNASEIITFLGIDKDYTLESDTYKIALIHEPDKVDKILDNNYNLVLAGHSHGGEIRLPLLGGLVNYKGATKYKKDEYLLNNTHLYITEGLGTSGINLRLGTTPTINLYRLYQY